MYVVMNFGVFVCSLCAGIHRELTHKVKGISMSNFTQQEIAFLAENGNAVSCVYSLAEPENIADERVVSESCASA